MILDLQCAPSEFLEVRINGRVALEICVGDLLLIEPDLLKAARANSALRNIVKDVIRLFEQVASGNVVDHSVTAKTRLDTLLGGFQDGLAGKTIPHPCDGDWPVVKVPPIRPQAGKTYEIGYSAGEAVKRAYTQASLLDQEGNSRADQAMIEESRLKEVNQKLNQVGAKASKLPEGFGPYDNRVYVEVSLHNSTVIACTVDEVLEIASKIGPNDNWEDAHARGWWPNRSIDALALLEAKEEARSKK